MSEEWHKGPPPSIGWWPASRNRNGRYVRWWDGEKWSQFAVQGDSKIVIEACARAAAENQSGIHWTARPKSWPERSRT